MILGLRLLDRSLGRVDGLAVRPILHARLIGLTVGLGLLSLFGVVVLLEVLLSHFPLDDHERSVDEGLLEQLRLEHPHQVLDADVLARRPLDDASVRLDLLLLSQGLLGVRLALLG